jgi:hypothetical protein
MNSSRLPKTTCNPNLTLKILGVKNENTSQQNCYQCRLMTITEKSGDDFQVDGTNEQPSNRTVSL